MALEQPVIRIVTEATKIAAYTASKDSQQLNSVLHVQYISPYWLVLKCQNTDLQLLKVEGDGKAREVTVPEIKLLETGLAGKAYKDIFG